MDVQAHDVMMEHKEDYFVEQLCGLDKTNRTIWSIWFAEKDF